MEILNDAEFLEELRDESWLIADPFENCLQVSADLTETPLDVRHCGEILSETVLDSLTNVAKSHPTQSDIMRSEFCWANTSLITNSLERIKANSQNSATVLWAEILPRKYSKEEWTDDAYKKNVNILRGGLLGSQHEVKNKQNNDEQMWTFPDNKTATDHKLLQQTIINALDDTISFSKRKIVLSNTEVNKNRPNVLGPSRFG